MKAEFRRAARVSVIPTEMEVSRAVNGAQPQTSRHSEKPVVVQRVWACILRTGRDPSTTLWMTDGVFRFPRARRLQETRKYPQEARQ
jgi:hypothetical protein